jgi:hypothetical protein
MGGLAGHMSHLYDNPKLTFAKLKEIFIAASEGVLDGTEKTDGQNLYLSFSVPNQKMEFTDDDDGPGRAARNKGNIKSGGLTVKQVVDKFADHPNQELKKSFSQALRAFEKVVKSFPREKQVEIFGPDTNIYYNAEIINPDTPNVISYDKKLVTLHRGGGGFFDKETGSPEEVEGRDPETGELTVRERDISANAETLAQALEGIIQDMESQGGFKVIMDAIQTLQGLEDKTALNKAISDLDAEISSEGISDNQMIIEYIMARIGTILTRRGIELKPETHDLVLKRLLLQNKAYRDAYGYTNMPRDLAPNKIKADLSARDKNKVINILENATQILKEAVQPIEHIVHDFSVAMLEGLESLFILDNKKGIEKIKEKVRAAKEKIESGKNKEDIKILLQQMEKLKSVENISTAAEGFVFDYDGYTYKFTGNFAPINQILGIGKYEGRGELPPLDKVAYQVPRETGLAAKGRMKLESDALIQEVINILLKDKEEKLDAIYLPGGFKPPHKGHWSMVTAAAEKSPGAPIRIVTGEVPRGNVNFEKAKEIWEIYINNSGLDVEVINFTEDGARNPWHWIGENAPESFGIVYSEKDKQYERIVAAMDGAVSIEVSACQDEDRACALSATNFREALNDKAFFKTFIPNHVTEEDKDKIWNILGGAEEKEEDIEMPDNYFAARGRGPEGETQAFDKETGGIEEMIYEMIEDLINEEYDSGDCTYKDGSEGCKVTFGDDHTACYETCGIAKMATGGEIKEEEELEEISAAGNGAVSGGAGLESPEDDHPRLRGAIRGIRITYERQERN